MSRYEFIQYGGIAVFTAGSGTTVLLLLIGAVT